jgi:DNA-binding NarL/FixJ family response regulator
VTDEALQVVIADDHQLVRTGFRMILGAAGIEVVAEAATGVEAVAAVRRTTPNVVLMDIRMPELDGLAATRELLNDAAQPFRVIVLTMFDLDEYVYAALRAGASGFLLKDIAPEQLVNAVRTIQTGDALLAPKITRRLVERYAMRDEASVPPPGLLERLTPREREVLRLVATGYNNTEIADRLFLSAATVKTHVARLLTKLGLRDRVQAVVLAYETGLVRAVRDR